MDIRISRAEIQAWGEGRGLKISDEVAQEIVKQAYGEVHAAAYQEFSRVLRRKFIGAITDGESGAGLRCE